MATVLHRIRSVFRALRTLWSIAGLSLLAILLTEAGLRLAFAIRAHVKVAGQPDRRVIADGYAGEAWPTQHYRELEHLQDRWQPYVYFRQRPYTGQTIAIDTDGLRLTWQPPSESAERAETKVFKVLT